MKRGQRHSVKCRCILSQFSKLPNPPQHQFIVFSVLDEEDDDKVVPKYAQCNNCGVIHKVVDFCRSEILTGKENMSSIITVDDLKMSLPKNLSDILERNQSDISTWEQAAFILENKQWGNFIILSQEDDGGTKQGKYVRIMGENFFKIENFSREEVAIQEK